MDKIKIGVVGVGHLGSIHARIYKEINNCFLVGICDVDEKRLKQVAKELGVEGYKDYHELFGKVEAVSIAVPTQLHYQIAKDFLKNKISVLVEKPFTNNLKDADSLIELAKKNNLILQVGHIERFNSAFLAVQKIIHQPRFIECHRLSPFTGRSLDVGVVLDLMIHDIDIVLGLVNSPIKSVEALGVSVLTKFEDIANARITFKNGCIANLTASRISEEPIRKIRIFQKDAYISLDYRNAQASVYKKKDNKITKEDLPIEKEEPLKKELKSFIKCVKENRKPLISGELAKEALRVALEIQKRIWKKSIL
ncbi:MAG: Gfo/Idh/MocA family oxidoreductase [Candidatus Omnitrophica bacterium]|nr:Gfo/Idh/MocA family oxidoreductase [Candidatus Omnitrophota bacterium]